MSITLIQQQHLRQPRPALIVRPEVRIISPQSPSWRAYADPRTLFAMLWRERSLITLLAWREFRLRYKGSSLGFLWAALTPLLLLGVYTFAFRFVLGSRFGAEAGGIHYAMHLFCGLVIFHLFSETVTQSPSLVLSRPNLIKRVVFPFEVLPVAKLLATFLHTLIGLALVLLMAPLVGKPPGPSVILLPVLLVPYLTLILGLSWLLASAGAFSRDLVPATGFAVHLLLFLTPVFYPLDIVPQPWQTLLSLNPLAIYVESGRRLLLDGLAPTWPLLLITSAVSLLMMQTGYVCFMKARRGFADVV